jgi:NagD protein
MGEPLQRLAAVRGFVFDMDGTLVLGDRRGHGLRPLPGAVQLTSWVARRGLPFVVFTNGTTRTPAQLAEAMRSIGFRLPHSAIMTPAVSAVRLFTRMGYQSVMVLGGAGLASPLREAGLSVVPPAGGVLADAVLAGWFPEFTMPALEAACDAVWGGAALYSCSQTPFFAVAGGRALGTSRAISAMIRSLTGCRVRVVGKPSADALRAAAERLGVPAAQLAVVGDDPELEVPMAHRGRALAIAVGTGLGKAGAYDGLPASRRPHLQLRGVDELLSLLAVCLSAGWRVSMTAWQTRVRGNPLHLKISWTSRSWSPPTTRCIPIRVMPRSGCRSGRRVTGDRRWPRRSTRTTSWPPRRRSASTGPARGSTGRCTWARTRTRFPSLPRSARWRCSQPTACA